MRLVSFFVISLFLHATILAHPVSIGGRSQAEFIQVTVLPMEQEGASAVGQGGSGMLGASKSHPAIRPAAQPRVEPRSFANPEPQALPADTVATSRDGPITVVAVANSAETVGGAI